MPVGVHWLARWWIHFWHWTYRYRPTALEKRIFKLHSLERHEGFMRGYRQALHADTCFWNQVLNRMCLELPAAQIQQFLLLKNQFMEEKRKVDELQLANFESLQPKQGGSPAATAASDVAGSPPARPTKYEPSLN